MGHLQNEALADYNSNLDAIQVSAKEEDVETKLSVVQLGIQQQHLGPLRILNDGPLGKTLRVGHVPKDLSSKPAGGSHRSLQIRDLNADEPARLVDLRGRPSYLGDAADGSAFVQNNVTRRRTPLDLPTEKIRIEGPGDSGIFGQQAEPT